jgi:hypothetical protein
MRFDLVAKMSASTGRAKVRMKLIRKSCCAMVIVLAARMGSLDAQTAAPTFLLRMGTTQSAVSTTYGTPYGRLSVNPSESTARVGVPVGQWDVYHVPAQDGKMCSTMVHFSPLAREVLLTKEEEKNPPWVVDSLMLMPSGRWSVSDILDQEPGFAEPCINGCDVILTTDKQGKQALLLEPQGGESGRTVLYFEGDSPTIDANAVIALDSGVSWAYALSLADFESHHSDLNWMVIGTWRPRAGSALYVQAAEDERQKPKKGKSR